LEKSLPPQQPSTGICPGCGAVRRLYRTPAGLRCEECTKKMDSGGLEFQEVS
jgi:predicted amidophosphoribosyltransferase